MRLATSLLTLLSKTTFLGAFTLLLGGSQAALAQSEPINLSNNPTRHAHGFTEANEDIDVRNHGTGIRLGTAWTNVRTAVHTGKLPSTLEIGAFHQRALNDAFSGQVELLYYRQRTAAGASSGVRLPALVVLNPLDNVSLHVGPQLQWQWSGPATRPAARPDMAAPTSATPTPITVDLVAGAEARIGFVRVGIRFALPFAALSNLTDAGNRVADDWHTGQVQAYLGAGF